MKFITGSKYVIATLAATAAFAQTPAQNPTAPPKKPTVQAPAAPQKPAEGPVVIVAPDTVVLTVGNEKMTRAQFEELLVALADSGRPATTPQQKRQVAEQLGELKSMAQEARKRKLDQSPEVKQMIVIQSENILAGAVAKQASAEAKPDDAAMHAYFEQNKTKFETAKASHILIRFKGSRVPVRPGEKDLTEEEALVRAQAVRKKLADGGDFAAVAKADSDDTQTGGNGGSLGSFNRGQMVPEFDSVAFSLPVGQISQPVKSAFGYHIIKVEERKAKTFEESRPEIEKLLQSQMGREAVERLKKQSPVVLDDSYFGKP